MVDERSRSAWSLAEDALELGRRLLGRQVLGCRLRTVAGAPDDRAARRPPTRILDVRKSEAAAVLAGGVVPERPVRAPAARLVGLDLKVSGRLNRAGYETTTRIRRPADIRKSRISLGFPNSSKLSPSSVTSGPVNKRK
jgi:hypothetical protein